MFRFLATIAIIGWAWWLWETQIAEVGLNREADLHNLVSGIAIALITFLVCIVFLAVTAPRSEKR